MVMLAKYTICFLRNTHMEPPPLKHYIPAVAGLVAGLGVLFERANRRKELVLFLIPHTLYALFIWGMEKRIVPWVPYSSVALFALSTASIMHAYEREPASMTPLINGILRYFVGERADKSKRLIRLRAESELIWKKNVNGLKFNVDAFCSLLESEFSFQFNVIFQISFEFNVILQINIQFKYSWD